MIGAYEGSILLYNTVFNYCHSAPCGGPLVAEGVDGAMCLAPDRFSRNSSYQPPCLSLNFCRYAPYVFPYLTVVHVFGQVNPSLRSACGRPGPDWAKEVLPANMARPSMLQACILCVSRKDCHMMNNCSSCMAMMGTRDS
jgi:hypothetical protein